MKKTLLPLVALSVLLAACSQGNSSANAIQPLDNPLYAEWYYKDLVENMMNLEIQNDPLAKDADTKAVIDNTRKDALKLAQEATAKRQQGKIGMLKPVTQPAQGQALLTTDTLYLGPDTDVVPGPELHVYLTPVADPLSGTGTITFPDASAIDLGVIHNPYGASAYRLPQGELPDIRSLVLWDAKLKRIYAFTQLRAE